jgi:hypothetical protein
MRLESLDDWPRCAMPGCETKICVALDSSFCFPHTPGETEWKHAEIDRRSAERGEEA